MTAALHAACERAVHIICTDGTILRAGQACLFVLEQLGCGAVARVLRLPPLLRMVEWGYKVVANHRDLFARFFFRRDHSQEAPESPVEL